MSPEEEKLRLGQPYTVAVSPEGIQIDGRYRLIRGGSVQWFRIPEASWEDRLRRYKQMGFNALDIYIAWNQIEPLPGEFNFEEPSLGRFLDLARSFGLYVAVRPGPFITNEMDGGGLPAWLTKSSTKLSYEADGRPHLRSDDPDFIEPTRRYLTRLNEFLRPYMADRGGPIILYVIENEYTWFEKAFSLEKLFWLEGGFERPPLQEPRTRQYFTALRDIVRQSGVTVPLVSCPGDGRASAMGDVADIIPFPNIYEWANDGQPEEIAYDLLSDMRDPSRHGGAYQNYPSGSMELNRSPQELRRLVMGGLDSFFIFNLVGMIQEGFTNSVTLAARAGDVAPHWGVPGENPPDWLSSIFHFASWEQILTGFVAPITGYFGNVIDYNGAISPSGVQRDLFYQFRRDNLFYQMVESELAASGIPHRSAEGDGGGLRIQNKDLGVRQKSGNFHYWHAMPNGSSLIALMNQSGKPQVLSPGSISFRNRLIPRFEPMSIATGDEQRLSYSQFLLVDWPLSSTVKLAYTTSEVLTEKPYNQETLLILYGVQGTAGELSLEGEGLELIAADPRLQLRESSPKGISLSYQHEEGLEAALEAKDGSRYRLLITTREQAGRTWFLQVGGKDIVLLGMEGLERVETKGDQLRFVHAADQRETQLFVLSPEAFDLQGWLSQSGGSEKLHGKRFAKRPRVDRPSFPRIDKGLVKSDRAETSLSYNDQSWRRWEGKPRSLESFDILKGRAWYRTEFEIGDAKDFVKYDDLYIQSASDIVGIYLNDQYIGTVNPFGTEIASRSYHSRYGLGSLVPYLKVGRNVLAFRTEIWGHGSFMFGKGTVIATQARIPALPYDGLKGLLGQARIGPLALTQWRVRESFSGELAGYAVKDIDESEWQEHEGAFQLKKGDILWYRTELDTDELPKADRWAAAPVLRLKGQRIKATVYFNGKILGRWLSDTNWLQKGYWGRAQRGMWVDLSPDDFPLPPEIWFDEGRRNTLAISFEDCSAPGEEPGFAEAPILTLNEEDIQWKGSEMLRGPGLRWRDEVILDLFPTENVER